MRPKIIALLAAALLTASTASAQIYPTMTDAARHGLQGPVEKVVDVSRSYSPQSERWEPLTVTTIMHFNRAGYLLKKGTYLSRQKPDKDLYTYDAESDKALPVFDITAMAFGNDQNRPLEEVLYAYEGNRLAGVVERNYTTKQTLNREYVYDRNRLSAIISRDSVTGLIAEIEQFYYGREGKPTGSTIRAFDVKNNPVRTLADTADVPNRRILRDYTSYVYTDTATPVIFWHWKFGNDTIVEQQEIRRYLADGMLSASTVQTFDGGKITSSQAYLYNRFGDVLSNAASFGSDTTFQRGFDYAYDGPDDRKNWTVRRQYSGGGDTLTTVNKRVLLSRTDRNLTYYP